MHSNRRLYVFLLALLGTFGIVRIALFFMPFRNLNIAGYNVHHLFTGNVMLAIAVAAFICEMRHLFFVILAGIGSALVLDEIVYLIATDGSDLAYLTPVSLIGSLIMISLMVMTIFVIYVVQRRP